MKPRVLIVCEHASAKYGGEAMLPLNYFRLLSKRLDEVFLVTHERVRQELESRSDIDHDKIYYVPDTLMHRILFKISKKLPDRVSLVTTSALMHLITQLYQWVIVRKVVHEKGISIIHEPAPVSPRQPSALFGFGIPVVVGPMNGGMEFPLAFQYMANLYEKRLYKVLRFFSSVYNIIIPGKYFARALLVANKRTEMALPKYRLGGVFEVVENGVFESSVVNENHKHKDGGVITVLYVGRLVDWKAVDLLIDAFCYCKTEKLNLVIVGDGPERFSLEAKAASKGNISFVGAIPHSEIDKYYRAADIFVLPSIRECGGAVVLEAMANGLPVIATNWGGPKDYVRPETGVLVEPRSRQYMVERISEEIDRLANDDMARKEYGANAISLIRQKFTWEGKVEIIMQIYKTAMENNDG